MIYKIPTLSVGNLFRRPARLGLTRLRMFARDNGMCLVCFYLFPSLSLYRSLLIVPTDRRRMHGTFFVNCVRSARRRANASSLRVRSRSALRRVISTITYKRFLSICLMKYGLFPVDRAVRNTKKSSERRPYPSP